MDSMDTELHASLKQAAHNNKLKKACLDNEEHINQLHSGEYTDSVQYQLSKAHTKAYELLASFESGLKWNLTTTYDISKLMRQCGLELSVQELYRADASPTYFDLIPLKKEGNALRKMCRKSEESRPLLSAAKLGEALATTCERLEQIESDIKSSQLDATDMAHLLDNCVPRIKECLSFVTVDDALKSTDEAIAEQNEIVRQTRAAQQKALQDGEMVIAEEASYTIIALMEKMMELIGDKFGILNTKEEENNVFADIFEILKESNKATLAMKQEKRRLKQRCETDLGNVHAAIAKSDSDDVASLAEFAGNKDESNTHIADNLATQQQLWRDMAKNKYTTLLQDIIAELRGKGKERYDLLTQRIDRTDGEEMRRVEYQQFLEVVANHKKTLELTIENCDLAVACIGKFEQMMNDLCNAIRNWHDMIKDELYNLRISVHKEHLGYFREMYLCVGNLLYKKEKKIEMIDQQFRLEHIQLEFCAEVFDLSAKQHSEAKKELAKLRIETEEDIEMLKQKAEQSMEEFLESEEALKAEGFEFVHPADEFEEKVQSQREKIVAFKAQFHKEEDVRIAAEREEIRRQMAIAPSKSLQLRAPKSPS